MVAARTFSDTDFNRLRAFVATEREVTIGAVAGFLDCTRRAAEEAIRAIRLEPRRGSRSTYVAPKPGGAVRPAIPWPVANLVLHPDLADYVPRMSASDQLALEARLEVDGITQPLEINLAGQVLWGREEFEFAVGKSLPEVLVVVCTDAAGSPEEFERIVLAHRPRSQPGAIDKTLQAYRLKGLIAAKAAETKKKTQFKSEGGGPGNTSGTDDETGETVERLCRTVGLPVSHARTLRKSLKVLDFAAQHPKSVGALFRGRLLPAATALDGIALPLNEQLSIFEAAFADPALSRDERALHAKQLVWQHTHVTDGENTGATPRTIQSELKRFRRPAAFLAHLGLERLCAAVEFGALGTDDEIDDLVADLTTALKNMVAARDLVRGPFASTLKVVGAERPLEPLASDFNVADQVKKLRSVKQPEHEHLTIFEQIALAGADNRADCA
jgi:hypothetical protein